MIINLLKYIKNLIFLSNKLTFQITSINKHKIITKLLDKLNIS